MKGFARGTLFLGAGLLSIGLALFGCTHIDSWLRLNPLPPGSRTALVAMSAALSWPEAGQSSASSLIAAPTADTPGAVALPTVWSADTPPPAASQTEASARTRRPAIPVASPTGLAELLAFSHRVANGRPGALCGLYVAGVLRLRVVQQPAGDPGFISKEDGTATQFQKADSFGAVGLLAHNTLAGRDFFKLAPGQDLALIYGDGRVEHFQVSEIADYQRLTLADLRSDFLALDTDEQQTADQVFAKFYQHAHRLTLQTCLKRGNVADWGVHFVVADPQPNSP